MTEGTKAYRYRNRSRARAQIDGACVGALRRRRPAFVPGRALRQNCCPNGRTARSGHPARDKDVGRAAHDNRARDSSRIFRGGHHEESE